MLLAAIEATNFRNLSGRIEWGPRLNIIYGNNGQGKTNWLEAIYLLARTKSFRTQRLQEAIKFGEELAIVRGTVTSGADLERELQVSLHDNSKTIFINSKRETLTRYLVSFKFFHSPRPTWKSCAVAPKLAGAFSTAEYHHSNPHT